VRTQAERATNIVNNLLNFSRTGSATEFAEIDVARVFDDTLQTAPNRNLRRSQIEIVRPILTPTLPRLTETPANCNRCSPI
jgi:signal transduction histidine kinase